MNLKKNGLTFGACGGVGGVDSIGGVTATEIRGGRDLKSYEVKSGLLMPQYSLHLVHTR